MKLIIAGSRELRNYGAVKYAVEKFLFTYPETKITEIVSGTARGADRLGERFAEEYKIPVKSFPPSWDLEGRSAGCIRNIRMSHYADALVALKIDGVETRGTDHMIKQMESLKKPVVTIIVSNPLAFQESR